MRAVQRELGITDAAAVKQLQAARAKTVEAALEEAVTAAKTRGASADPTVAVRALEGLLAQRRAVAEVYAEERVAAEAKVESPDGAAPAACWGVPRVLFKLDVGSHRVHSVTEYIPHSIHPMRAACCGFLRCVDRV